MPATPGQAQLAFSGASVVLAAVLAWVTYLYYQETKAHTEEMQKTREQEMKPVLKPTIDSYGGMIQRLEIVNTGPGAAHDVTTTCDLNTLITRSSGQFPCRPLVRHTSLSFRLMKTVRASTHSVS